MTIKTEQARKQAEELRDALNGFSDWENRPLNRVHCFTWPLALTIDPSAKAFACGIRIKPEYRRLRPGVQQWRDSTAALVRKLRKAGKITLPVYDERTAKWIKAPPLRFVTRAQAVAEGFNINRTTKNAKSLHTITRQLFNEGYSEVATAKVSGEKNQTFWIFYVKHPAINP